jgi:hypothetical protein
VTNRFGEIARLIAVLSEALPEKAESYEADNNRGRDQEDQPENTIHGRVMVD